MFFPMNYPGKVSSLIGVCEAVSPLFYNPMYSLVYTKSLTTMPGAFYLLGSGLTVPALLIFMYENFQCYLYLSHKKITFNMHECCLCPYFFCSWMYVQQRRESLSGEEDVDSDTFKTSSIGESGLDIAYTNPAFEREKENYM